jgi:iron complex outermembrane recepter protein
MNKTFKLKPLATAVLVATGFGAHHGFAQTDSETDESMVLEEVVVSGIRGSLQRARDMKRDADSIMEAISAEDIGKFPDNNIAESLQRITGVTISRERGQGQQITVRGMGPEYNAVSLNGRVLATDNLGRELNFDVIAAELVGGAEVVKSPTASLTEGSIGAAINVRTHRPLALKDLTIMGSIKGTYNNLSEEYNPIISGLVSNTFMDGKLGALVSLAYTNEEHRSDYLSIDGRDLYDTDGDGVKDAWGPDQINQRVVTGERSRASASFAVEYQPNDEWHFVLDGLYSKFKTEEERNGLYTHILRPPYTDANNVRVDDNNNIVGVTSTDAVVELVKEMTPRFSDTYQVGLNVEFLPTDNIEVTADLAYSEAVWDQTGDGGYFAAVGTKYANTEYIQDGDIPEIIYDVDVFDPTIYRMNYAVRGVNSSFDDIGSFKLDGKWHVEKGILTSLQSGIAYSRRNKEFRFYGTQNGCAACGYNLDVPDEIIRGTAGEDFMSEESGNIPRSIPNFDHEALFAYLQPLYPGSYDVIEEFEGNYSYVRENLGAFYIQANFEGMFRDMAWSANAGVRQTTTEQIATGRTSYVQSFGFKVNDSDPAGTTNNGNYVNLVTERGSYVNDYEDTLPSANFKLEFTDELTLRLAAAKVITRPSLSRIGTSLNIDARAFSVDDAEETGAQGSASAGNPFLEPYRATQYDASLEWYPYDETGFVFAYFRKDLESFVTDTTELEIINGREFQVSRSRNGDGGEVDGFEAAVTHTFIHLPSPFDGLGIQANYTFTDSSSQLADELSTESFKIEGLSEDAYNFILFYDKGPLEARLAYNYRSNYLRRAIGEHGEPEYVDDYAQIDFSSSYEINDHLSVIFEGQNLTNERTLQYQRIRSRVRNIEYNGRILSVGLRANF